MTKTICALISATFIGFIFPAFANVQVLKVQLKTSDVTVYESMVTIADVATIESKNRHTAMKIGELDLELLKKDGDQVRIDRKQIEMRIRVSEFKSQTIRIGGSTEVTVTRMSKINPSKIIKRAATVAIAKQFGLEESEIRVSLSEKMDTPKMTALANAIESAIVVLPTGLPLGEAKIRFVFQDDQGADQSLEVKCRVTVLTDMVVAKRTIPSRTTITKDDVKVVNRPLEDRRLNPASNLKDVIGKTARTVISIHDVVTTSDLTDTPPRPIVNRNDIVDVLYTNGPLSARFKNVKVLSAGAVGDPVEFINPQTQKRVIARVVNESLIEMRR